MALKWMHVLFLFVKTGYFHGLSSLALHLGIVMIVRFQWQGFGSELLHVWKILRTHLPCWRPSMKLTCRFSPVIISDFQQVFGTGFLCLWRNHHCSLLILPFKHAYSLLLGLTLSVPTSFDPSHYAWMLLVLLFL